MNMTHPHRFGFRLTMLSIQISKVKEQNNPYLKYTHVTTRKCGRNIMLYTEIKYFHLMILYSSQPVVNVINEKN